MDLANFRRQPNNVLGLNTLRFAVFSIPASEQEWHEHPGPLHVLRIFGTKLVEVLRLFDFGSGYQRCYRHNEQDAGEERGALQKGSGGKKQ